MDRLRRWLKLYSLLHFQYKLGGRADFDICGDVYIALL